MNRILLTGMLCVMMGSAIDAAPRNRRARRRASRRPAATARSFTTQPAPSYYNYGNNYRTASPQAFSSPSANYGRAVASSSYLAPTYSSQPVYSGPERVTAYKPVIADSVETSAPMAFADTQAAEPSSVVAPISTSVESGGAEVVQTSNLQPVPDVLPTLKSSKSLTQPEPFCASCTVIPAGQSFNSALAELNSIRAQRGLPALIEDPSLSAIAHRKASIQANAGTMYHPGGSMGGARFEGVGMGPRFTSCYQNATNVRYAGAATVTGRNGQRYHCLLVK